MLKRVAMLFMLALLGLAGACAAAEVQSVVVGHDGNRYHIDLRMQLAVTAGDAWDILKNFNDMRSLNPIITYVHATQLTPDRFMVKTVVHGCVLVFCRDVTQLQDVRLYPESHGGTMDSTVVPAGSDFSYGVERWSVPPCPDAPGTTCLRFTATLEPSFWIPPWIGGLLVEHQMRKEAEIVARGVERRAQELRAAPAAGASVLRTP